MTNLRMTTVTESAAAASIEVPGLGGSEWLSHNDRGPVREHGHYDEFEGLPGTRVRRGR